MYVPGMVAACCSRVGVGVMIILDTNQDTPTLHTKAHWTRVHVCNCCPSMGGGGRLKIFTSEDLPSDFSIILIF